MTKLNIVHVNRHKIKANKKLFAGGKHVNELDPPLALKHGRSGASLYDHHFVIVDEAGHAVARVTYQPDHMLSCGAVAWVESPLEIVSESEYLARANKTEVWGKPVNQQP